MNTTPIVQRAFELAQSGEYTSTTEIRAKLVAEHYMDVDAHLSAPSLHRQLKAMCRKALREQQAADPQAQSV